MPLFAYHCRACSSEYELLVRKGENPSCPECGSKKIEKQLSRVQPMRGGQPAQNLGCGTQSCCQMQGGGCLN